MEGIDRAQVQLLLKFLEPFREESTKLEGELYPTLPLAVPVISSLKKHCETPVLPTVDENRSGCWLPLLEPLVHTQVHTK